MICFCSMNSNQTISFFSQGCRLNHSETDTLQQEFINQGFTIVNFKQPAEITVINTCTVTENGDSDTRKLINQINKVNPQSQIALIGCQAQILKEKLLELNNVKWVIGNNEKMNLANIIRSTSTAIQVDAIKNTPFVLPISETAQRYTRANIKVQDGCNFYCSFCIIPFARGPARSRDFQNIIDEAKALVSANHKEIVLTGINIGTYNNSNKTIVNLVDELETINSLDRIRISSIEPTTIPKKLYERLAGQTKLCPYLHIPIQSGCDSTLNRMRRKYSTEDIRTFFNTLLEVNPDICIGTDVIVGFPGETDDEFEETISFIKDLPFAYCHVFSYSERKMAHSRKFENPISSHVIKDRSLQLRQLSAQKKKAYYYQFIGRKKRVLIEQKKHNYWIGHTDNYIKVKVSNESVKRNDIIEVTLSSSNQILI